MGCDIHVFVEYRDGDDWRFLGHYHPGRDYHMFGLLAGVRDDSVSPVVEPRGFPDDATLEAFLANSATTEDELNEEQIARVRMGRILGADLGHLLRPNLDWHSHSWLRANELAEAIAAYNPANGGPAPEWVGLVTLLRHLPEGRMVFFFDN